MDGIYSRIAMVRKMLVVFYDIIAFVRQYLPSNPTN